MGGPEDAVRLDTACLLIAAHARTPTEATGVVSRGIEELDGLAESCPGPRLDDLRRHLFDSLGFTGDRRHYDDPRNSYLDEVLARRTGIPITLSVVTMEVGRRLGLGLTGVGMPGHFLVGVGDGRYLDAFDGGRLLDAAGCRHRFSELAGVDAPWSPELLRPTGPFAIVARVLANLRQLFATTQDLRGLDWVLRLRLGIPGVPNRERVERASVLAALGRYDEAAGELERLARAEETDATAAPRGASRHPSGGVASADDTAAALRSQAARLRARLN